MSKKKIEVLHRLPLPYGHVPVLNFWDGMHPPTVEDSPVSVIGYFTERAGWPHGEIVEMGPDDDARPNKKSLSMWLAGSRGVNEGKRGEWLVATAKACAREFYTQIQIPQVRQELADCLLAGHCTGVEYDALMARSEKGDEVGLRALAMLTMQPGFPATDRFSWQATLEIATRWKPEYCVSAEYAGRLAENLPLLPLTSDAA
jgi:hypothetical protein